MKYTQKGFSPVLADRIREKESDIKGFVLHQWLPKNQSTLAKKDLKVEASFDYTGKDLFEPGYSSSISIGISDENEELIDIHTIKIWECERTFLGMPITAKIPGSKVTGELLDDSLSEIKAELKEYIQELTES